MAERDERFLSRWSRLKQRSRDDVTQDEGTANPVAPDELALPAATAGEEDREASENRQVAEAIDIDALKYGDDFSPFLKRGVPEPLRRRALRKFFASDPLLANLDGLNDYDEDFNNPEFLVYRSAWDAARGFLTEAEKAAQQATGGLSAAFETEADEETDAAGAAEEIAEDSSAAAPVAVAAGAAAAPEPDAVEAAAIVEHPAPEPEPEPEPDPVPRRVSIRRRLGG